jgi:hypothetical protein
MEKVELQNCFLPNERQSPIQQTIHCGEKFDFFEEAGKETTIQ